MNVSMACYIWQEIWVLAINHKICDFSWVKAGFKTFGCCQMKSLQQHYVDWKKTAFSKSVV